MKRIIKRIAYDIRKNSGFQILKLFVYTAIFSLLFLSIYIHSISLKLENNILSNFKIYSGIYSEINTLGMDYQPIDFESYLKETEKYKNLVYSLAKSPAIQYFDLNASNLFLTPIKSIQIDPNHKELTVVDHFAMDYDQFNEQFFDEEDDILLSSSIKGITHPQFLDMYFNAIKITSGRTFTQDEIIRGENVCIVNANSLILGKDTKKTIQLNDVIPMTVYVKEKGNIPYQKTVDCKVIGIYQTTTGQGINSAAGLMETPIYIPMKLFDELHDNAIEEHLAYTPSYYDELFQSKTYLLHPAIFGMESIQDLKAFLNEMEKYRDLFPDTYRYFSSIDSYYLAISNVLTITDSFHVISNISFIMSFILATIMITFECHFRKKEIGILKSLGEKTSYLLIQFTLELVLITFLSMSLSNVIVKASLHQFTHQLFQATFNQEASYTQFLSSDYELTQINEVNLMDEISQEDVVKNIMKYEIVLMLIEEIELFLFIKKIQPKQLCNEE